MSVRDYPGWVGMHTRDRAPGHLPNGTRVRKVMTEPGDTHPVGSMATILGSMHHPMVGGGYFVEWDATPRHAVFVISSKIEATA